MSFSPPQKRCQRRNGERAAGAEAECTASAQGATVAAQGGRRPLDVTLSGVARATGAAVGKRFASDVHPF